MLLRKTLVDRNLARCGGGRTLLDIDGVEVVVLDPEAAGRPVCEHLAVRAAEGDGAREDTCRRLDAFGGRDPVGRRPCDPQLAREVRGGALVVHDHRGVDARVLAVDVALEGVEHAIGEEPVAEKNATPVTIATSVAT